MPATLDQDTQARIADYRARATPDQLRRLDAALAWEPSPHADEWQKCKDDIYHWIEAYCGAYDPRNLDHPYGPFLLFPVQRAALAWLAERDRTATGGLWEKSRDSGATYLCAFYALHCWLFREGDATGFGSRKLDLVDTIGDPSSIFEKIRLTFRALPDWMKPAGFIWSKHSTQGKLVNPANGSTITGEGGDNIGRGGRTSRYFVDEAAHIEHKRLIDAALSQNTNVRIDISTPCGLEEFYTKKHSGLVSVFRSHWIDDRRKNRWTDNQGNEGVGQHSTFPIPTPRKRPEPDHSGLLVTYPWYERERLRPEYQDTAIMAQEVDIDYIGSGRPRFNRDFLMWARSQVWPNNAYAKGWEPVREEKPPRWAGEFTTFRELVHGHEYAILVDTARGLNLDNRPDWTVAHVFDLESCEQVAHYRGQMTEGELSTDLYVIGQMYNWAMLVVETPGPGEAALALLVSSVDGRKPYPRIYHHWDEDARGPQSPNTPRTANAPGLRMTVTSKPEGDGKLAAMLEDSEHGMTGAILIRHPNTFEELIHFSRLRGDVTGAESGAHDDEVSCLRLLAMVWGRLTTRGKRKIGQLRPVQPQAFGAAGWRR